MLRRLKILDLRVRNADHPHDGPVGVDAELAFVVERGFQDHLFLQSPLQDSAGINSFAGGSKGLQDLGPQRHGLKHLDRKAAGLGEGPALLKRGRTAQFVEDLPDSIGIDTDSHGRLPSKGPLIGTGHWNSLRFGFSIHTR